MKNLTLHSLDTRKENCVLQAKRQSKQHIGQDKQSKKKFNWLLLFKTSYILLTHELRHSITNTAVLKQLKQ